MPDKKPTFEAIGQELVNASKDQELDALPLTTRLFPYMHLASRRMSLRGISRWLEEKHGVNLSYASISRAMNRPKHHLQQLAEYVAPIARYVAGLYNMTPMDILYEEYGKDCYTLEYLARVVKPNDEESDLRQGQALELAEIWLPIPEEVKGMLKPYMKYAFTSGMEDEDFIDEEREEIEREEYSEEN